MTKGFFVPNGLRDLKKTCLGYKVVTVEGFEPSVATNILPTGLWSLPD